MISSEQAVMPQTVAFRITEEQRLTIDALINNKIFTTRSSALRHLVDAGISLTEIPGWNAGAIERLRELLAEITVTAVISGLIADIRTALMEAMSNDTFGRVVKILSSAKEIATFDELVSPKHIETYLGRLQNESIVRIAEAYVAKGY